MPPNALRHSMEWALLLVAVERASGVPSSADEAVIFSSTLMNGCFTTPQE